MPAQTMTIDFTNAPKIRQHSSGITRAPAEGDLRGRTEKGLLLTPKQIRARARRAAVRQQNAKNPKTRGKPVISEVEFDTLYKPVDEWDMEELAKGRPRDKSGGFKGVKPKWVTREVHERAMERFTAAIKQEMGVQGITALDTLNWVMNNNDTDDRGKPLVPASTKVQAAQFLLEHIVGKPKQRLETDISIKLQAILGDVLVNPADMPMTVNQEGDQVPGLPGYTSAHFPGHTIPMGIPAAEQDEDYDEEELGD